MPLVRLEIRNEFGLGQPEHRFGAAARPDQSAGREDPKAVLDGLAVSGLVGILRQLGDLAEFAAEVFHGLQEQVTSASSRSHSLTLRVQRLEASLPPLEKAVLAQTTHLHFAYTPGSEWHPRIRIARNHFIHNDLPHFIMDSYEECRGPPRLHLLDKFDIGGPGSCLKRYSDPSFFKRASATSDEATAEKLQRERKARRSKKRRSSKQFGDLSRVASISSNRNYSFGPPVVDGRSSSSQTTSTIDPGVKYDPRDNLNSFDSRAESGYIECVFRPSSSKQAGEQEPKDSPSFNMVRHNDASDSASHDDHARLVDDSLPRSSLQEQMTSTSSCVTWDEKAEILEPTTHQSRVDEILYLHQNESKDADGSRDGNSPIVHQMDMLESEGIHGNSPIVHQMDMLENEGIHGSVCSQNGIDEIDSEPDNYLDALNTIESESENDLDYRTKRVSEQFSSIPNVEGTNGMHELTVNCSDHPPTFESRTDSVVSTNQEVLSDLPDSVLSESGHHEQILASELSSEKQVPSDLPNSCSSESHAFDQKPERPRESSADNLATTTGTSGAPEGPEPETIIAEMSPSATRTDDAQDWSREKAVSNISKAQESPTDASSNSSVKIWTNGGLLGLMPSKPPDFTMASPVTQDFVYSNKPNLVSPLDSAHGNSNDLYMQNGFGNSRGNDMKESSIVETGKVFPVALNAKHRSSETNQNNDDNSSLVFGLGRRLLSNGFGRKVSDMGDGKFEPATSVTDSVSEQRSDRPNQIVPERSSREQFGYGSALSPAASPPLEHMKISFHPLDGIEASKLKLKFSDGKQSEEKIRDTFPTFQLIPEAVNTRHDYNSDSDDDTFCRSSPFMSDDCLSLHSESNSEQWEYGEPTEGCDSEILDALCGISSIELVPSSLELDGVPNSVCFDSGAKRKDTGIVVESSICNPILDLPNFDAVKPALQQETDDDFCASNIVDSSPMLPPLPPMEWRASKPQLDVEKDKLDVASEAFKQALGVKLSSSANSMQLKPAPPGLQHTSEEPLIKPKCKEDEQKPNTQKELNHSPNGKGMDEKDFLQQIRAKSFSLRRTCLPEKSTGSSGPAANVNVSAILEKANAIRQAVGSDDGEDDTWSDT